MKNFTIQFPSIESQLILEGQNENVLVNGIKNDHYKPSVQHNLSFDRIATHDQTFPFTSISVNSFVDQ